MKYFSFSRLLAACASVGGLGIWACAGPSAEEGAKNANDGSRHSILYERRYHYDSLDEDVTIHKGQDGVWCQGSKSGRIDCQLLKKMERLAYFNAWGAMTQPLARRVSHAGPTDRLRAEVLFDVEMPKDIHANDAAKRAVARRRLSSEIQAGSAKWERWVAENGGRVVHRATKSMPQFTIEAPVDALRRLSRETGIRRMDPNVPGYGRPTENGMPAGHAHIGVDLLNPTLNGQGVNVGILGYNGGLRLYNEHEAFAQATITEHRAPVGCRSSTIPTQSCPGPSFAPCINDTCVDEHESQVAGTISAGRSDSAWGAYKAHFFHYNELGDNEAWSTEDRWATAGCNLAQAREAYDWFQENNVSVVNESFGCFYVDEEGDIHALNESFSVDGIAQDYYSRVYEIFISKAVGNDASLNAASPACPHTLNSMCVGGVDWSNKVSCLSNWRNPSINAVPLDREEPDIMALSGNASDNACPDASGAVGIPVISVTPSSTTLWANSGGGTSFSAPQIAMFAALKKQECPGFGSLDLRTFFKLNAHLLNPEATKYSTPGLWINSADYRDGAGFFDANAWAGGCSNQVNEDIDLENGVAAPFQASCVDCGSPMTVRMGAGAAATGQAKPMSVWPFYYSGRRYKEIADIPSDATRIRAVANWAGCSESDATSAPSTVGVDFDLFLVDTTPGFERVVYASQSDDDNSEGFDYDLTHLGSGSEGQWKIYLGWPEGAIGCSGAPLERVSYGFLYWH